MTGTQRTIGNTTTSGIHMGRKTTPQTWRIVPISLQNVLRIVCIGHALRMKFLKRDCALDRFGASLVVSLLMLPRIKVFLHALLRTNGQDIVGKTGKHPDALLSADRFGQERCSVIISF